jgi:hypothetical protein
MYVKIDTLADKPKDVIKNMKAWKGDYGRKSIRK